MYCLKPTLTVSDLFYGSVVFNLVYFQTIPKGDWFCNKCKPEEEIVLERSSKKNRKIFTEESEEEGDEDEDEEKEEEKAL